MCVLLGGVHARVDAMVIRTSLMAAEPSTWSLNGQERRLRLAPQAAPGALPVAGSCSMDPCCPGATHDVVHGRGCCFYSRGHPSCCCLTSLQGGRALVTKQHAPFLVSCKWHSGHAAAGLCRHTGIAACSLHVSACIHWWYWRSHMGQRQFGFKSHVHLRLAPANHSIGEADTYRWHIQAYTLGQKRDMTGVCARCLR